MPEKPPGAPGVGAKEQVEGPGTTSPDFSVSERAHDVVILGSGPAGLTAAIYVARANLHPLVLEGEPSSAGNQPGGQLMITTDVENYPGFVDGILGPDLMARFRAQAARFGAEFLQAGATRVDFGTYPFGIWTRTPVCDTPTHLARCVIIATGAQALLLGLPSEARLMGHGVSTCATCDGFFFQDEDLAVIGGGDSALEEAIFLTKYARSVTVVHRRRELRASKIMQERARCNPKITFCFNHTVEEVLGDSAVSGVRLRERSSEEETELAIGGLFVAIGHRPNTDLFTGQLDVDEMGYLRTGSGTATNVPGVFACGDVQDHVYRQAVTAAGSGCMAAIDAERWLET